MYGFVVRGESVIWHSLYVGVIEKPPPPPLTARGAVQKDGDEMP